MGYLVMQNGNTHQVGKGLPAIACFHCGICCIRYRPKLGDDEVTIIASKLGMSREIFRNKFVRAGANLDELILDDGGEKCPFLAWDNRSGQTECTVHSFRPQACRSCQASLSRVECQEGLRKLQPKTGIILPQDIYPSEEEINNLYSILQEGKEVMTGSPYHDRD